MDGIENIKNKIISDADTRANEIILDAKTKADAVILSANDWASQYETAIKREVQKHVESIVSGKRTMASLSLKKTALGEKQKLVARAFDGAYNRLLSLDKKAYLTLVESKILAEADDGDQVVLSRDGVLTDKDIVSLKVFKDKNLSVSKTRGDFDGGVILVGKNSDKDLSFKSIIDDLKVELTPKVATILFGE